MQTSQYHKYSKHIIQILKNLQAVLGHSFEVKTLNGNKQIKIEKGTQHGHRIKLAGYVTLIYFLFYFILILKGITKLAPNQNQRGDHYVVLKIDIPSKLTDKQKQLFQEIASLEEKANDHTSNSNGQNQSDDKSKSNEDIFGKFKNMWGSK